MKYAWAILLCCLFATDKLAAGPTQFAYRISFTDKNGSSAPSLSARSLLRRATQNILLDSADRPVVSKYVDSVLYFTQGTLHNTSRWLNQCVVLLTDSSKIHLLDNKPFIKSVAWVGYFASGLHKGAEPVNAKFERAYGFTPYGSTLRTTGSSTYYGSSFSQTKLVNGDYLHDRGYKGKGLLIAVLDAGFTSVDTDPGFDSLRKRNAIVDKYNFLHDDSLVFNSGDHGTACLSIMGGNLPGTYVGTAPDAIYALYATEDNYCTDELYELDNMVAGLERADSLGADVISSSLGYNDFTCPPMPYFTYLRSDLDGKTTSVAQAINKAVSKGMFAAITAGNEGTSSWSYLLTPGDADSCTTVGSVSGTKVPSLFSGPGYNAAGRIKPDVCLQGESVALMTGNGAVGYSDGTSFSTPQLAGWAACLWQTKPAATPYQLRQAINLSADHAGNPNTKIGYGVPDFSTAAGYLGISNLNPQVSQLLVMPNPFTTYLDARVTIAQNGSLNLVLTDVLGRTIIAQQNNVTAGTQTIPLNIPANLSAGIYLLKVTTGSQVFISRLVHP